ncbi:hypothetical protein [Natrinema salinisoli]|uniref:hypothetical protein n=1 Tax=Natrinema salinisoli TaxID=2878535 RepID=UPI001CEFFA53|nr:hypothetical protein [Natrinema salinisoli]
MTRDADLPRLFDEDDQTDMDVAYDAFCIALQRLPINAYPSDAQLLINQTASDMNETVTPRARRVATGALETQIRREYGHEPRV